MMIIHTEWTVNKGLSIKYFIMVRGGGQGCSLKDDLLNRPYLIKILIFRQHSLWTTPKVLGQIDFLGIHIEIFSWYPK